MSLRYLNLLAQYGEIVVLMLDYFTFSIFSPFFTVCGIFYIFSKKCDDKIMGKVLRVGVIIGKYKYSHLVF